MPAADAGPRSSRAAAAPPGGESPPGPGTGGTANAVCPWKSRSCLRSPSAASAKAVEDSESRTLPPRRPPSEAERQGCDGEHDASASDLRSAHAEDRAAAPTAAGSSSSPMRNSSSTTPSSAASACRRPAARRRGHSHGPTARRRQCIPARSEPEPAEKRHDDDGGEQEDGNEHEHGGGPCNDVCVRMLNLSRCPRPRNRIGSTGRSIPPRPRPRPGRADITLVEYGSYACPYCRAANEVHRPAARPLRRPAALRVPAPPDHAATTSRRRAADLAEHAGDTDRFWHAHVALMTRSDDAHRGRPRRVVAGARLPPRDRRGQRRAAARRARDGRRRGERTRERRARDADVLHQRPALRRSVGRERRCPKRCSARSATGCTRPPLDFASWAPSTGVLLLLMSVARRSLLVNSPLGPAFAALLGSAARARVRRPRVPDAAARIGSTTACSRSSSSSSGSRSSASSPSAGSPAGARPRFPIAAALGGMAVPALMYAASSSRPAPWSHGWGIPMATDTAFAVALIVMLGSRVPVELRVFLTAAVDRRRHRRDRRRRVVLFGRRCSWALSRAAPWRSSRRSRCSTARASIARCRTRCSASRCGSACTQAGCTRRSPA